MKFFIATSLGIVLFGCSTRPYTHFLIEPEVDVAEVAEESLKTPSIKPKLVGPTKTITMRWNDGETYSEIDIPLNAAGRIIIENRRRVSRPDLRGPSMVLPAPTKDDTMHLKMHNSYLSKGLTVNKAAQPISLSKARVLLDQFTKSQNYGKALLVSETVLARYPTHPEFLKAQGSLFLLVGDKEKAIESYEKSLEVYDDAGVNRKLNELDGIR